MRRVRIAGAILVASLLVARWQVTHFDDGGRMDGWYAYDYREGLDESPAVNVFRDTTRVGDAVWVGHHRWSIDDPESPPSVLALMRYEKWDTSQGAVATTDTAGEDLRGTCVTFDLRGQDLDLEGGTVDFWVMSSEVGQRWHTTRPIRVVNGGWTTTRVEIDHARWRNSWRYHPADPPNVDAVLAHANSYGIGFVAFDGEPTGRLGMRGFRLGC